MANGTLKVSNIETSSGSGTITLGQSGETLALGSGVTSKFNQPAFLARNDAAQSITANTNTKVTFGTEEYDTDSCFADSKFTVPTGGAGKYYLYTKIQQDLTDNTHCRLGVFKNGSEIGRTFNGEGRNDWFTTWTAAVDLAVSDYIEIYIYQNSSGGGAARDTRTSGSLIYTFFGGYRIGA
tara:strand:+ start:309 stop:851 length:543 start_codon:yes stop_codon:yes gene_type:complete